LNDFVHEFHFSDFLFFWRDLWEILVLCIFVCFALFCEFLDFLHFREFLVLVVFGSVLTAGLTDKKFTTPNPPTSDLNILPPHTKAYLPPNHTLPPHNRTLPSCTTDLTPDPAVDMGGAAHALT